MYGSVREAVCERECCRLLRQCARIPDCCDSVPECHLYSSGRGADLYFSARLFPCLSRHPNISLSRKKTWSYQTPTVFVFDAIRVPVLRIQKCMVLCHPCSNMPAYGFARVHTHTHIHTHTQIKRTDQELDLGLDIVAKGMTRLKGIFYLFAYL